VEIKKPPCQIASQDFRIEVLVKETERVIGKANSQESRQYLTQDEDQGHPHH
jgi:hypothetical protein